MRTHLKTLAATPAALIALSGTALASTGGGGSLPWDGPLQIIEQDLSGTVAHVFVIIAIVTTGLFWTFGEHGSSMRKIAGIAAGGSIALGATSLISGLGLGSGAVIGGPGMAILPIAAGITIAAMAGPAIYAAVTLCRRAIKSRADRRAAQMAAAEQARYEWDRELDILRMRVEARRANREYVNEILAGVRRLGEKPEHCRGDMTAVG